MLNREGPKIRVILRNPRKSAIQTRKIRGAADPQEHRVGTRPTPTRKEINGTLPKMLNREGPKIRVLPRNPRKSAIQTRKIRGAADPQEHRVGTRRTPTKKLIASYRKCCPARCPKSASFRVFRDSVDTETYFNQTIRRK